MKIKANQKYQHKNITIFIDFVKRNEVGFRKWKNGEFYGLYRMPLKDFKYKLHVAKLVDPPAESG